MTRALRSIWPLCLLLLACREMPRSEARAGRAAAPPPALRERFHLPALDADPAIQFDTTSPLHSTPPFTRISGVRTTRTGPITLLAAYRVRDGLWVIEDPYWEQRLYFWDGKQLSDIGRGRTVPVPGLGRVIQKTEDARGLYEVHATAAHLSALAPDAEVLGNSNGALVIHMSADDDELLRFKRPGQDFELRRYTWEGFHATGPDAIRGDRMLVLAGFQQDRLLTSMGDEPPIEAEMAIMNLADGKLTRLGTAHGCWSIDTNVPQPRIGLAWRTPTTQPRLGNCVTYIDP